MSEHHTPALALPASRMRVFLPILLLFVLTLVPYLPAIHGQFTWDDNQLLVDNPAIHAWNGLHLIWNPFLQPVQYFPLTYTTFWLEHKLWGLDPTGYHIVNVLLQSANAVILYYVLRRLGLRAAFFAALLWAIHPVNVESVAWIAERKNTLSTFFYFLSILEYLKFARISPSPEIATASAGTTKHYILSLFFFAAALFSKTLICTLPVAILILLWWKNSRITLRSLLPLLPFFALTGVFVLITTLQEHANVALGGDNSDLLFSPLQRLIISGKNVWFYVATLVFPYPLMAIYPRWTTAADNLVNYLPLLALLLLIGSLFAARRKIGNAPLAAFLYFVLTLLPLLGFINFFTMHYSFVGDHYQYPAAVSLVALAIESLHRRLPRRVFKAIAITLAILFTAATAFYSSLYQTPFQMWSWNVAHNPNAYAAQHNLASEYAALGNLPLAEQHARKALELAPDDATIQTGMGRLLMLEGRYAEAVEHFQRAAQLRPALSDAYDFLGDAYMNLHRDADALDAYKQAADRAGINPRPYRAYAEALVRMHHNSEALAAFEKAIDLDPGNLITRYNYANHLLDAGRFTDAIAQYQFILQYQPDNAAAWDNLAFAYHQLGQDDKAIAAKNRANQLDNANK
jgi:tetratricopeptide (TPR) repeat protein